MERLLNQMRFGEGFWHIGSLSARLLLLLLCLLLLIFSRRFSSLLYFSLSALACTLLFFEYALGCPQNCVLFFRNAFYCRYAVDINEKCRYELISSFPQ